MTKKHSPVVIDVPAEDTVPEVVEAPLEPVVVPTQPKTHVAVDGDSYASIAARYKAPGSSTNEYAKTLLVRNGGKTVTAGALITL